MELSEWIKTLPSGIKYILDLMIYNKKEEYIGGDRVTNERYIPYGMCKFIKASCYKIIYDGDITLWLEVHVYASE